MHGRIKRLIVLAIVCICVSLICSSCFQNETGETVIRSNFQMTDSIVCNPYVGYAPRANSSEADGDCSLVYIDITFAELQPNNCDEFDFEYIDEKNNVKEHKENNKTAVLRFVCDMPSTVRHSDIPSWLMECTKGEYYDISYGSGYCPDYSGSEFIKYHKRAIEAIADYYDDGFVSYVELGSLGHWGEWHIKTGESLPEMPCEDIRNEYVMHYVNAFKHAKLLMRRPFRVAKEHGLGLYNDILGKEEGTDEWLGWIKDGGEYTQTGEKDALLPMEDFWKTAPSGGELASSLPIEETALENADTTIDMLKKSHTTFIGPKSPLRIENESEREKADKNIMPFIGYRIGITEAVLKFSNAKDEAELTLKWENTGVAPMYFEHPVWVFVKNGDSQFEKLIKIDIELCAVLPGDNVISVTHIPVKYCENPGNLYVAILDNEEKTPAVTLISNQKTEKGYAGLFN